MEWLNWHHLLCFWATVRHGGITNAAAELRLRPPTLSAQIRRLEEVRERFYAVSAEPSLKHPAALALSETARTRPFG